MSERSAVDVLDLPTATGRSTSTALRLEVEEFLTYDADLLDRWLLMEWLELFTEESRYVVPATDHHEPDLARDLTIVCDDYFLLEQRVASLLTRSAHAEFPHSRTRRLVTNVVARDEGGEVVVRANFTVHRFRLENVDTYVGSYRHRLVRGGEAGFRFLERRAILDLEALRPHGKVSIIL